MTRKEYELVFQAFKSYRCYMTREQEVLSEKILDDLFYPEFDKLATDDLVADAEEALANESEIKSLNFRQESMMAHKLITYRFTNKKWGIYKKYEDVAYIYFSKLEKTPRLVASKL